MRVLKFQFTLLTLVCVAVLWAILLYLNLVPRIAVQRTASMISFGESRVVTEQYGWPLLVSTLPRQHFIHFEGLPDSEDLFLEKISSYRRLPETTKTDLPLDERFFVSGASGYWSLLVNCVVALVATILVATIIERYSRKSVSKG